MNDTEKLAIEKEFSDTAAKVDAMIEMMHGVSREDVLTDVKNSCTTTEWFKTCDAQLKLIRKKCDLMRSRLYLERGVVLCQPR